MKLPRLNLGSSECLWTMREVLLLWLLVFAAHFLMEYLEVTPHIMESLSNRYFILIKEPLFQYHLYVFISTFLIKLLAVAIIWAILRFHKIRFFTGLNLNIMLQKEWLWLFFAFFVFAVIVRVITDVDPLSPNLPIYMFFRESSIMGTLVVVFSLAVVAPISEEIFFRGFVYPAMDNRLGFYPATLITAALFTGLHVPQCKDHPQIIAVIFLSGLFLTFARAVTKSTLMTIMFHSLYNITIVIVGFIKFLVLKY